MVNRLPPRERQITTIIIARGEASAEEVRDALPDPISGAAVRSMLTRLLAKNVLLRRKQGRKYLYRSASGDTSAREAAVRRLSRDYFGGSLARVAAIATALVVSDGAG
jgi:predicted transcriptional regulator